MCTTWFLCLFSLGIDTITVNTNVDQHHEFKIGENINNFSDDQIEMLHNSKHSTPIYNTVYKVEIPKHPGYFYTVVINPNGEIVNMSNGYLR